ncbi:hypothetical protein KCP75_25545 [Salmonella enterica subsp. enterica]|nr:hypothetical protein KCP75_25545 [Salmonella enterica subsp. enterica]
MFDSGLFAASSTSDDQIRLTASVVTLTIRSIAAALKRAGYRAAKRLSPIKPPFAGR